VAKTIIFRHRSFSLPFETRRTERRRFDMFPVQPETGLEKGIRLNYPAFLASAGDLH